jgi:hypothetical protein
MHSQVERVATGIVRRARRRMLESPKLCGHAVWQVPLDGVHTHHGHHAPPKSMVRIAHHVQLEVPLSVLIRPPVYL